MFDWPIWDFFAGAAACYIALLIVAIFAKDEEETCECHSDYCQCKYEEEIERDRNS